MATRLVSPTRMELTRLKKELATAKRGHKLLKDKQDEMVRQFMDLIRRNRELRTEIESSLLDVNASFEYAKLKSNNLVLQEAIMVPSKDIVIECDSKSIMNIVVPKLNIVDSKETNITYSFAHTPSELDDAILELTSLTNKLVELAQIEKSCDMLAVEIEKTRRRVNAIEFVLIPDLEENIHFITLKLEDNERSNIIRLMKSKEIIAAKNGY
ncbi:MAG: V-type ATP synthase subunit D [Bacilli bacterium]|nr:V-type ATP synthase subunit D [Bacilli bacterium]